MPRLALSALCAAIVVVILFMMMRKSQNFEILYSSFRSTNPGPRMPPPLDGVIHNTGDDNFVVDFDSKNMSVSTIFLHKPEDEPMLRYIIKGNMPIKHEALPAGTKAELWVVESNGRCWSSPAVPLPMSSKKENIKLSVSMCI